MLDLRNIDDIKAKLQEYCDNKTRLFLQMDTNLEPLNNVVVIVDKLYDHFALCHVDSKYNDYPLRTTINYKDIMTNSYNVVLAE